MSDANEHQVRLCPRCGQVVCPEATRCGHCQCKLEPSDPEEVPFTPRAMSRFERTSVAIVLLAPGTVIVVAAIASGYPGLILFLLLMLTPVAVRIAFTDWKLISGKTVRFWTNRSVAGTFLGLAIVLSSISAFLGTCWSFGALEIGRSRGEWGWVTSLEHGLWVGILVGALVFVILLLWLWPRKK